MRSITALFAGAIFACNVAIAEEAVVAGVLRNTGNGWHVLSDREHEPLNIASVANDETTITLTFGESFTVVRTFIVTADETYATRKGLICGASVGLSKAVIMCSSKGRQVDPRDLIDPYGNLWVYGLFQK